MGKPRPSDNLRSVSDEGEERFPHVANVIRKLNECRNNRFVWENLDILEEYVRGRLCIVVEFDDEPGAQSHEIDIAVWADIYILRPDNFCEQKLSGLKM